MRLSGVLDSSVIIGLAKGDCFEKLPLLFGSLFIPPGVRSEVLIQEPDQAGVTELSQALGDWIIEETPVVALGRQLSAKLSLEDREVIALAKGKGVDYILTSDEAIRKEALGQGINCLRATEVVVLPKRQGLITSVTLILDLMRHRGFGIRDDLYQEALQAVDEVP